MSKFYLPSPATNKRLDVRLDGTHKIQYYGLNNVYPQEQEQVRLASPLIKSSTEILEDFINGTGWEDNNDMIVNELGDTVQDVLNLLSLDYAKYNGFALHINFNGKGEIESIQNIPFEYCRLGLPNDKGVVSKIVVSNNWEQDPDKLPQGTVINTTTYSIYNPLAASSELLGGNTTGQVLYFAGLEKDKYPLSTFDAIISTGETDEAIQLYERNNVKKGFHGTTIFKYPGKLEDEEDKFELKKTIDQINGPDAPGILAMGIDEDFTGDLLETIDNGSDDTLFDATLTSILNRVLQTYKLPPALLGVSPEGAVFSQSAYLESFTVFNVITRNRRDKVSRIMNSLTELWFEGSFNVGRILENKFNIQGVTTQEVSDKITTTGAAIEGAEQPTDIQGIPIETPEAEERIETEGRSPEELQSQANLRGSVGGVQGILEIQNSVAAGTTPYPAALVILQEVYGFTEEIARGLLGPEAEIKLEPEEDA